MEAFETFDGVIFNDHRGSLISYNDLDLARVKRLYIISVPMSIVRGWQGHKKEKKWFYVCSGSFKIVIVKVNDFNDPELVAECTEYVITAESNKILHVPGGYANGFQALTENSKLMVFSDCSLEQSKLDHYRFELNLWYDWNAKTV